MLASVAWQVMAHDPRVTLVLALADDELILGHRHAEWTGWAPHIEEDLAFSSIAQDEMAHARLLYELLGESDGRDVDALAFGRSPDQYRNAVLCERPNADWYWMWTAPGLSKYCVATE